MRSLFLCTCLSFTISLFAQDAPLKKDPSKATLKRQTGFSINLNAYAGTFLSHEVVKNDDNNHIFNTSGIYAPVGITFSKGYERSRASKKEYGGAFSFYAQVIDVGALGATRLQQLKASRFPEMSWKNLFAPGAYVIWEVPHGPVSVGAGIQKSPGLRDMNVKGIADLQSGYRWSFSIAYDLPLMNLYSSPKND